MDTIETITDIFDNLRQNIVKNIHSIETIEELLLDAQRAVLNVTASNPLNTMYIMNSIRPIDYIIEENPMCPKL